MTNAVDLPWFAGNKDNNYKLISTMHNYNLYIDPHLWLSTPAFYSGTWGR